MSTEKKVNQVTGKFYHHCDSNFQDLTKMLANLLSVNITWLIT